MGFSPVAYCQRALVRIGAAPITSFSDGTAEAEVSNLIFYSVRDGLLAAYPWSFATKQAVLVAASSAPAADYAYAYTLPSDYVRALSAGNSARSRGLEFRIQAKELHCNAPSVVLNYIYRPAEVDFPVHFDPALIARLAAELVIPLTESTSRAEAMFRMAEQEFQRARQVDAMLDTPGKIEDFTLTNIRG